MASPHTDRGQPPVRRGIRPTGGLKAFADAKKLDSSLIVGPVQRHVLAKEGRDLSRRQDIIHPSEMSHSDWCPKATYLRIKNIRAGGEFAKEAFGFQTLNIFQHGHEVHHKWQTWLWEMGELWGTWFCSHCLAEFRALAPQFCFNCGKTRSHLSYGEIPLSAEKELLISGSADGGVPEHNALLEFKTVGVGTLRIEAPEVLKANTHKTASGKTLIDYEGLWRGITRPFSTHQKQGQIYLHICKLHGLEFDKIVYIYESKFNQGNKEFVVKYRESIIAPLLESAERIRAALDDGGPPPECPLNGCKHCEEKGATVDAPETTAGDRGARHRSPHPSPPGRAQAGTTRPPAGSRRPIAPRWPD